ncbi:hypothetical protein LVJ94_22060 [Pendulispora rubella]|uniref:Flagellar M-ring N-terminal domain-containing protein n=1 Tax=Pendulispora rubella TaxID=2741070 RepID=A0ABZ2LL74_9BACT
MTSKNFLLACCIVLIGCNSTIAVGLDEDDANRVVVALDHASIEASKEADPNAEGKYHIVVAREDSGRALAALRDEELPRTRSPGLLEAMDKNTLVPSQAVEHAQIVAGLAGDLQRTLEGVDGVLSARVHLNLPAPDPVKDAPVKSSASVLVSYRGPTSPLSDIAVQRLVSGGVPGLALSDVAVVMIARPALTQVAPAGHALTHIGPFVISRASKRILEVALPMALALVFAFFWFVYFTRFSRLRAELASVTPAPPIREEPTLRTKKERA